MRYHLENRVLRWFLFSLPVAAKRVLQQPRELRVAVRHVGAALGLVAERAGGGWERFEIWLEIWVQKAVGG